MTMTITIDGDKKCGECGKGGATPCGLCLGCATKAIGDEPMKSAVGQAVRERWLRDVAARKERRA
jgi:hypothetical protein